METTAISIIINGLNGTVELNGNTVVLTGPWADSSGRYDYEVPDPEAYDAGQLFEAAEELYERNKILPFAVGADHVEQEWKFLRQLGCGSIAVRVPAWHRGIVALTLEAYGMKPSAESDCCWAWDAKSGVNSELAHMVLAPILDAGTRFSDERVLAEAIDSAVWAAGYRYRSPLNQSMHSAFRHRGQGGL